MIRFVLAAMIILSSVVIVSADDALTNDTILVDTCKNVIEISGTDFEDYKFFGGSDGGISGIDVGSPGYTAGIRNFLMQSDSDIIASTNPGVGKNTMLLGSMVGYSYNSTKK